MRTRDIAIVLVSIAALFGLWSQEGTIAVNFAFFTRVHTTGHHRYLPKPLVADIDGDGYPEVVLATHPDKCGFIRPYGTGGHVAVTLELEKAATFYANIIGMSTGYLSFPDNHSSTTAAAKGMWFGGNTKKRHSMQGHKQHIAVVTDDYKVTLFSDTFVQSWSVSIAEPEMTYTVPHIATVLLLPDRIYEHDMGMVVVSTTITAADSAVETMIAAFNGATGELRWRHVVATSAAAIAEAMKHNFTDEGVRFKFTEKDLREHANTLSWTKFRDSVVASMPHSYSHPWDSQVQPFRFVHTKNRKKSERHETLMPKIGKRPKEHHALRPDRGHDNDGELGQRFASALHGGKHEFQGGGRRQHVRPLPNSLVLRGPHAVNFIHLFTGRSITAIGPLQRDTVYDDLDDDLVLDQVRYNIGVRQESFGRHGFDESFVCEGEIRSNVPAADHLLTSTSICDTEGYINSLGLLRHLVRGDAAEQAAPHLDPLNRIGSRNIGDKSTQAVRPVVVHLRRPLGRHIFKSQRYAVFMVSHGTLTAVDVKSRAVAWRADTPSSFDLRARDDVHDAASVSSVFGATSEEDRDTRLHQFPHLATYNFHTQYDDPADIRGISTSRHRHEPLIIAAGSTHISLIDSFHGTVEAVASIDQIPIAPVIVADFDGDGVNDMIFTTPTGFHGFTVKRHVSGSATAMILVLAISIAVVLYISQHGVTLDVLGNTAGVVDDSDELETEGPILGRSEHEGLRRRTANKRSTD